MSEHKNKYPRENNTGHFWDDEQDLRELNNRPPRWYMQAMAIGVIAVVIYSFYYPSIPWFGDHYKGSAGWTQVGEMNESVKELEDYRAKRFAEKEAKIKEKSLEEILEDEDLKTYAIKTSKTLFGDNCAACHGASGQGNEGFPVLADDDWLYGGKLSQISTSITKGRRGNMPAAMMGITQTEAQKLAEYLIDISNGAKPDESTKSIYMTKGCIGCHAPTMKGNVFLGSANLSDSIYRFTNKDQKSSYVRTIMHGVNQKNDKLTQNAEMPAFSESGVITPEQIKKLTIYVHQLGGGEK